MSEATTATATATTTTTTLTIPTYESSKNSDAVKNAKALLNAGDFEGTLEIIEDALVKTNELLVKCSKGEEADFHESIAPLSYLYGTTLLYSIEESQDTTIMEAQAVQAQAHKKISGETSQQQKQQQKQESVVDANNMNNNAAAEDIEIAWENLDVSRAILEKLHTQNPSNTLYAIDLAQVHQRLGDLQRGNGNYHGATLDYQKSLSIRYKILGRFDRTVADSHYSLGMTYLLCAAVVAEESATNNGKKDDSLSEAEKEVKKSELRRKAVLHYLSCGCSFAGLIANMCGEDEHEISSVSMDTLESEGMDNFNTAAWWEEDDEPKKMSAASKKGDNNNKIYNITQKCSNALLKIRQKVSKLNLKTTTTTDISEQIHDMKEVLDEIQETIDSSEESVKVVDDLSKMKSEREMEAEREDENALKAGLMASLKSATGSASASASANGATTTIGFGGASAASASSSTSATTTIGFGSASLSAAAAAAFASSAAAAVASSTTINTVMVKKKKKKRTPQANDAEETKRVKTE